MTHTERKKITCRNFTAFRKRFADYTPIAEDTLYTVIRAVEELLANSPIKLDSRIFI